MFSKAYVKVPSTKGGTHHNKLESQSLKTICVDKCLKSDILLFYHPPSKTLISDADGYKFDNFSPSGPQFRLQYDGSYSITQKSTQPIHQQPQHEMNEKVFVKVGNKYKKAVILRIPLDEDDNIHTVQVQNTGELMDVPSNRLHNTDPTQPISDANQPINSLYP